MTISFNRRPFLVYLSDIVPCTRDIDAIILKQRKFIYPEMLFLMSNVYLLFLVLYRMLQVQIFQCQHIKNSLIQRRLQLKSTQMQLMHKQINFLFLTWTLSLKCSSNKNMSTVCYQTHQFIARHHPVLPSATNDHSPHMSSHPLQYKLHPQ